MAAKGQALALILGAIFFSTAVRAECSISSLQWMLGSWVRTDETGVLHQHWETGAAGEMIGFSWGPNHVHPGDVVEVNAIEAKTHGLILRKRHFDGLLEAASEGIDEPVTYRAVLCAGQSVTFDGVGKWIGGYITYTHKDNVMTIDGHAHDNGRSGYFHLDLERK